MIVVFRGPIFHFAIKTYVSHKIPLEGEWDFNYSYVSLQEHGIAFHDVTLLAEDESISCSIGKIFCYAPQVQKASLKNHFILEDVEIGFAKQMVSEGSSLSPDQLRSILRTLRQVEIKNGLLRIPSREVAFSLGKSVSSQKLGALVFSGDHHGLLKIDLSSWADRWIMDVEARQSSVKHFKAFFDFFMGEKVSKWEIESGKFDGRAFIAISSHNQIKDARLHFTLLNGKMKNEEAGIDSSFKRVFFDLDYPTSSEEKNLIDNIKFSSSIDGGSIHVYNENEETRFHFKDLSGFMTMDAFTEAAIDVTGFVEDGGRVLPVKFLGSPTTKNGDQLELDLALQIDPLFDQTARVHVLCSHDDGEFLLQTKFDSLEVRQMMIFQECISLFYPAAREFSISKGKYSGDMLVAFDQHGIKDFSLRNMLCSDVAFYSKSNDISFSASKVAGELELDLFHEKRTLVSGWEMDLEDGSLLIGREDGLPFHFENTTVKVTAKDGRFVDSYINTEISGIRGRADIDGSMQKPILDVLFSAKGEAFLQWFSSPASSYDNEVMISSRIEKEGDSFLGTGTMTLHDESYSSEIAFDFKGENKEIEEVTFHSEGILGRFYPFFNEVLGFDWSLDGDFSLHGKYDKEKILCAFTGRNATYREKHSMIKGAEGSGYFERNLASGDWSIDITLNKGHKKLFEEKKFCLKHAQLKISSGEKFFRVRSLEGFMDLDNSLQRLFVDVRRFDMTRGGKYYGDVALRNEDFELMRLLAKIEGGVLTLEEGSHLLEEKVALKECLFGEDWKISAQTIFHLDDIFFPKMVRERNIGDLYCALELDGTKYHFSAKGEKASASLKGVGKNFSVEVNGISFDAEVKDNAIYFGEGVIPYDNKHLHIKKGTLSRNGLFADGEVRGDGVDCTGSVEVAFAEGISCTGSLEGSFAPSNLQGYEIVTITPLQFSYDGKVTLEEAQCLLCENGHQLAKFFAKRVCFDDILEKIEISNLSAVVDKKVIQKKYEVDLLEDLSFAGDVILFPSKKDFVANIACEKQDVRLFEKELSFHQVVAKGNKKAFKINAKMPLFTDTIDLSMNAFFDKKTIVHLDGYLGSKKVLDADGLYEEEFELLRAKGELVGVTFDITPSSELQGSDFKLEAGLNLQKMKPLLAPGAVEFVERMGFCKGLEVAGSITTEGLSFEGIIKGTDFDFLDYSLASLFGKLYYQDGKVTLSDFSVADRALIVNCPLAFFDTSVGGCLFDTKKFEVESLRPCLLSSKGERKKLSSPFMLEKIDFQNVHGDLADLDSLQGSGYISFVNSFDTETNPVFGMAKEIIGRIGLDPVLMVPVVGRLDFQLGGGKMNFTKMVDTYSDQQRSYFFLWHKTPSYIDFDGNVNIDIRMKQYVLFKFTELFIISVDGTIGNPQVHLK